MLFCANVTLKTLKSFSIPTHSLIFLKCCAGVAYQATKAHLDTKQ